MSLMWEPHATILTADWVRDLAAFSLVHEKCNANIFQVKFKRGTAGGMQNRTSWTPLSVEILPICSIRLKR